MAVGLMWKTEGDTPLDPRTSLPSSGTTPCWPTRPHALPAHGGRKWAGNDAQREGGELTGLLRRQGMRGCPGGPREKHKILTEAHVSESLDRGDAPFCYSGRWGRNLITVKKEKRSTSHQTPPLPADREAHSPRVGCILTHGTIPGRGGGAPGGCEPGPRGHLRGSCVFPGQRTGSPVLPVPRTRTHPHDV